MYLETQSVSMRGDPLESGFLVQTFECVFIITVSIAILYSKS